MNEKQKAKTFFSPLVKEEVFDKLEEELLEVPRQMPLAPVSEEVIENVTELSKLQQDPKLVRVYDSSYLNRIFEGKKDVIELYSKTKIDKLVDKLLSFSTSNEEANENEVKFFEYKRISLIEYIQLVLAGFVNTNIKTNRPDVNKEIKKQEIVRVILKGNSMPDFCLCLSDGNNRFLQILLVNDGGHRTRSFLEFLFGLFPTCKGTYFLNSNGVRIDIGGKYFSEIVKEHPEIAKRFLNAELKFDVYHHITPLEMTEEFQDRNKSSDTNHQEGFLNSHCNNVVADFIRNIVRMVEGEQSDPHLLFCNSKEKAVEDETAVIGFKMDRLNWDNIVSRIMTLVAAGSPTADADDLVLEETFSRGCIETNGHWARDTKVFKKVTDQVIELLDMVHGVMNVWPKVKQKHTVIKNNKLVYALVRFLLYLKHNHYPTNDYVLHGIKDYQKFAKKFEKAFFKVSTDTTTGRWLGDKKKGNAEREKGDAFSKYLATWNDSQRAQLSIDFLMELVKKELDEHPTTIWGLDVRDKVRTIDEVYVRQRHDDAGGCECCGRECKDEDGLRLVGAHIISHADGIEAGGFSSKENGRACCEQCNSDMGTRNFYEYKESGDWKKFLC